MVKSYLPVGTPTDEHLVFGGLEKNPKVAFALGCLLGEVGVVEHLAIRILALLLGDGQDIARAEQILGPIQSISVRFDIIKALASVSDSALRERVLEGCKKLLELNALRNEYAHAMYETHEITHCVTRTTWPTSTDRKRKVAELKPEAIAADVDRIRLTYSAVMRDLFADQLRYSEPPTSPEKSG